MITVNPLSTIVTCSKNNPDWCCEHDCAIIINLDKKIFKCIKCTNDKLYRCYYQADIHELINKKK